MAVKAFSSVSVIDFQDAATVQLYLTSNQPLTVIYDPNTTGSAAYTPSWADSPYLVITPIITVDGTSLPLNAQGLSIEFKRKVGSNNPVDLITGESVSGGVLTVRANMLSPNVSPAVTLLSYICTVTFTDPNTNIPVTTEATLTYSLLTIATELKQCEITGENVFLYDSDRNIVGSDTIVLTSTLSNVSVSQWQYKNSQGNFVAYPTTYNPSITGTSLTVKANDVVFNDRTATIKLATNDSDIYDIHVVTKIYDGAAGTDTVSVTLTNENHYLPCDSHGGVKSWVGSASTIHIYEAGVDETSSWTINTTLGTGLTGTYNSSTYTFTPSALTEDTSYVDFVCTKTGFSTITKRFTLTKVQQGADGDDAVIYECVPNSYVLNYNQDGEYTPSTVTFYAYYTAGNSAKTAYDGRFKLYTSTNGSTYTAVTNGASTSDESSRTFTPTQGEEIAVIKCELYEAGALTNLIDEQTVVINKDGIDGDDGDDGKPGISMGLGNYQDVIPCTPQGAASAAKTINIPFYAYAGIVRIPVSSTVGTLPSGVTLDTSRSRSGTASQDGLVVLNVANGATFSSLSALSGEITITLTGTYEGQTQSADYKYTWTKNLQSTDGQDAVNIQLYSPDGGVIRNSTGTTTIAARVMSGRDNVTSNTSYVWKQFSNGSYNIISNETNSTLVVTANMVTDYAFFECDATYDGITYYAYYTVDDLIDPYMAFTTATVSEFKNSTGFGAVYTRLYQNGQEVDLLKSTSFLSTPPEHPSTNDYYYHLDATNKTCTLKRYNGSSWVSISANDEANLYENQYSYYRIDKNGNSLDTTIPYKTTRTFYIDPSMIDGQMQFICEVSDKTNS